MKRFITKTLFYFIPFFCIYGTYKVIEKYYISGDLGKLGQIPFGNNYVENMKNNYLTEKMVKDTLIISYEKFYPSKKLKIFSLGDSFSQQKIFGYQNYISHLLNDTIINIGKNGTNFETAISLLNSGIIDSSNCRILILEQVDRYMISNLCNIDFDRQYNLPQNNDNQDDDTDNDVELYNFCSWIRLQFGYDSPVFKHNLKQDCFTHRFFSRKLFRYVEDFDFQKTKPEEIEKAKENLILFNKKVSEKGIKLIFLIAADKYDVYRPFMTDNTLPIDTTTDGLSNITGICVINTKSICQKMVQSGIKDVYMLNDTHWSYKASEEIAKEIVRTIDSLQILNNYEK